MKRSLLVLTSMCAIIILSGCATGFRGTTTASPRFNLSQKRVALVYEAANSDQAELRFLAHLHEAFMREGYTVTERIHYPRALWDLMDNSLRQKADKSSSEAISTTSHYGFSPRDILQLGKLYDVDLIAVYSRLSGNLCTLRIINVATAEVVATTTMTLVSTVQNTYGERSIAQLLVMSLKYAAGYTTRNGHPRPVILDISNRRRSVGKISGIDRIFYQEPLVPMRSASAYGVIFSYEENTSTTASRSGRSQSGGTYAR